MRFVATLALCALLLTGVADATFADDLPPPPPPPLASGFGSAPANDYSGLPYPEDEVPAPIEETPAVEEPPPVVIEYEPAPAPAAPIVAQPRVNLSASDCTAPCGQRRDNCCWPLDWCGNRYGCREITLEGMAGIFEAPEGPFGLAVPPGFPPPTPQLSYDDLDYGWTFGGRVTARYWIGPQEALELRGTYNGSWDDDTVSNGRFGFAAGPFGPGPANGNVTVANALSVESEADLFSGEANWWTELACEGCTRWDIMLGIRYARFDEELTGAFANPVIPGGGPASVASDVENSFIGAQLGGAMHRDLSDRITFTISVKGLIGNMTREANVSDANIFAGGSHSASSEDEEIVWGIDADIGVKLRLTPRIAVTAGYNFFFLDSVLRAHDAMDFGNAVTGAVQAKQDTDQLIVHSFFLGVNFNF